MLVLAGQVTLDEADAACRGHRRRRYAVADHAGSVRLAIDDAANQLIGLAAQVAAPTNRE